MRILLLSIFLSYNFIAFQQAFFFKFLSVAGYHALFALDAHFVVIFTAMVVTAQADRAMVLLVRLQSRLLRLLELLKGRFTPHELLKDLF